MNCSYLKSKGNGNIHPSSFSSLGGEKYQATFTLSVLQKKPDAHDKPLQVMSFDFGFFNHLQIMQENGVVFELKMSDTTSDTNVMGYSYNSARAMYEPVLKEK